MEHNVAYYRYLHGTNGTTTAKEAQVRAHRRDVTRSFQDTINWETVQIEGRTGTTELEIIPTDKMTIKKLKAKPGDTLRLGDRMPWRSALWLVTDLDADDMISFQGEMTQCNYRLRWQLGDGTIHDEWGVWEDAGGTGSGESSGSYMDTPNFSLRILIPMNAETLKLGRGKRFLAGTYGTGTHGVALELTRVNPITYDYRSAVGMTGLLELTLSETQFNEQTDNAALGVADYVAPAQQGSSGNTQAEPAGNGTLTGGDWF